VATFSVGCFAPESLSLHPLFERAELVAVPQLAGTWVAQKEDDDGEEPTVLRIEPTENPFYGLVVTEDGEREPGELVVGLGRIGETLYWNLTALPADREGTLWSLHRLSVHSFARLEVDGGRLGVAWLRGEWLSDALRDGWVEADHTRIDDTLILTGGTRELQRLVAALPDEEAFQEATVFLRR
jgi:hypothetical protein